MWVVLGAAMDSRGAIHDPLLVALVQNDSLEAAEGAAGKVKCIYIDPPYKTGEQGWVYSR
jgi:16S rRNA G966 N2-methylase RsmD